MSGTDDLQSFESWAAPLLDKLGQTRRKVLERDIAQTLRRTQKERITAQKNPDGSAFVARRPRTLRAKKGRIKKRAKSMFAGLKTARYLQILPDSQGVAIGYRGGVAKVATVHQEGRIDQVAPNGPRVKYAQRSVLGLTEAERGMIKDKIFAYLGK